MINQLFTNPVLFLIQVAGLLIAITIHELAHAWAADQLGDPNPRLQGRLTFNPLAHLDPVGTAMMLLTRFGWGKPVPVDPFNFKNPRRGAALASLAGPGSNFILAGLASLPVYFLNLPFYVYIFLISLVSLNISLGVFNLIPIPPLDGSKILLGILPKDQAAEWEELLSNYSTILLILILIPFNGVSMAGRIISPIVSLIIKLLLPA